MYRFNLTLNQILKASDDIIKVEGIVEDIDVSFNDHVTAIQCKYHEEQQKFQWSTVYKPILQMMKTFCMMDRGLDIKFILYAYFPTAMAECHACFLCCSYIKMGLMQENMYPLKNRSIITKLTITNRSVNLQTVGNQTKTAISHLWKISYLPFMCAIKNLISVLPLFTEKGLRRKPVLNLRY